MTDTLPGLVAVPAKVNAQVAAEPVTSAWRSSVICAYVAPKATSSESLIENVVNEKPTANPNNLPNFGASQQKQAPAADKAAPAKTAQPEKK